MALSTLIIGGAAASAEGAGGARVGAEEVEGWGQTEGGEPQQSWGGRKRWEWFLITVMFYFMHFSSKIGFRIRKIDIFHSSNTISTFRSLTRQISHSFRLDFSITFFFFKYLTFHRQSEVIWTWFSFFNLSVCLYDPYQAHHYFTPSTPTIDLILSTLMEECCASVMLACL